MSSSVAEAERHKEAQMRIGFSRRGLEFGGSTYGWHLFGLTPLFLWVSYFLGVLGAAGNTYTETFYISEGVCLLVCAAYQLLTGRHARDYLDRFLPAIAVLMLVAPVAFQCLAGVSDMTPAWLHVAVVIGSACWALLLNAAANTHKPLDVQGNAVVITLSFAAVSVLRLPLGLIGGPAMGIAGTLLVIVFVVLIKLAGTDADRAESAGPAKDCAPQETTTGLAFLVVLICAFGFSMGILRIGFDVASSSVGHLVLAIGLQTALPVGLLVLFCLRPKKMSMGLLCQIALVFVLLTFAAMFAFKSDAAMASALSGVVRFSLYVVLYFALSAMATRLGMSHSTVFCVGWGLYAVFLAAGIAVMRATGGLSSMADWPAMTVMGILACVTFLSFNFGEASDVKFFGDGRVAPIAVTLESESLEDRCARITADKGLTRRELEVMVLICKGRSRPYIAEELMLSENTVRTYAKALYSKLDVHSRQDLLTLMESTAQD